MNFGYKIFSQISGYQKSRFDSSRGRTLGIKFTVNDRLALIYGDGAKTFRFIHIGTNPPSLAFLAKLLLSPKQSHHSKYLLHKPLVSLWIL